MRCDGAAETLEEPMGTRLRRSWSPIGSSRDGPPHELASTFRGAESGTHGRTPHESFGGPFGRRELIGETTQLQGGSSPISDRLFPFSLGGCRSSRGWGAPLTPLHMIEQGYQRRRGGSPTRASGPRPGIEGGGDRLDETVRKLRAVFSGGDPPRSKRIIVGTIS